MRMENFTKNISISMYRTLNIYILSVIYLFLIGCNKPIPKKALKLELENIKKVEIKNEYPQIINTSEAKDISTKQLTDCISNIDYIALDSEHLIGEIRKMIITESKIYIMDSFLSQQVFVFDKQGKLLFCIDEKGNGPEEFISIWDMQVNESKKEILLNDALGLSYIYYSTEDGSFIKRERGIQNCYLANINNIYINMLSYGQDFNDKESWQLLITDKDSILYKGFQLEELQKNNFIENSISYDFENKLIYTPTYSDTIYQFCENISFIPKFVIKQNKSIWNKHNENMTYAEICKLIKENNYTLFTGNIIDSERYMLFTTNEEYKGGIIKQPYIWDKINKISYRWDSKTIISKENIRDVITIPLTSYNDRFYGIFQIGKDPELKSISPKLAKLLPKDVENANPIIVAYQFKDIH